MISATFNFGECGAEFKNVRFADTADRLVSEFRDEATVQGGQQRANVAATPFDAVVVYPFAGEFAEQGAKVYRFGCRCRQYNWSDHQIKPCSKRAFREIVTVVE
ncbi:hypothetical protein [Rhodoferax sp.]|uniref:hypothetical protein n=1 Tax=Rhodoferax sp. TaxID=50421 RepID=UPI00344F1AB1